MSAEDQEARRQIREQLDESFFVEAAAGTGKTSELIRRVINSIARGRARMHETVIVTFTRKAAGELKLRLRQSLESARLSAAEPETKARLEAAIARLEDARVGTIHAFAGDLLRERPVEARLDPEFVALEEHEALELFRKVFTDWFERRLGDPSPGLQRILSREPSAFLSSRSPKDRLVDAAWQICSFRDFDAPWPREPFERDAELDVLMLRSAALVELLDRAGKPRDPLTRSVAPLRQVLEWAERAGREGALDRDALEGSLVSAENEMRFARERRGHGAFLGDSESSRGDICVQRDHILEALSSFVQRANADLVSALRNELFEVTLAYEKKKAELGKLDFTDLLICTRNLLREHAAVRASFQGRWSRIYVDELQDTDPLQLEVLLLLAADDPEEADWRRVRPRGGKLFLVGDPKQSIYGFRRADLALYQDLKTQLVSRGMASVTLSCSFRATAPIQQFINHCFEPLMIEDAARGQPGYVALEGGVPSLKTQPSIVALPVADPEGITRQSRTRVARALPDLVASWVTWLLTESGWTIRSSVVGAAREPIQPRHVALLFRRYAEGDRDTTAPYLRALEARGLPHVVVGARAFYEEEEIESLRAAAIAIEWPEDELAVFATLHGPLFAIEDSALLRYRLTLGELHPLQDLPGDLPAELEPIGQALTILRRLHDQRNQRPIIETITELMESTRAHASFAMRPAGPRVLGNLHRLLDLASAFERRGGLSFRGFVERLEAGAEHAASLDSPVVEESAEGIRVITAHSAKGLEFPVVVLADLDGRPARANPARHLDSETGTAALRLLGYSPQILLEHAELESTREAAEDLRLAYVAATRARDLLVVPAVETGAFPSWFSSLSRGLYPEPTAFHQAEAAPGCPPVGERPPVSAFGPVVHPGLHSIAGAGQVVWWDANSLRLRVADRRGLRAQDLLRERPTETAQPSDSWRERRAEALRLGSAASLEPFTATAAAGAPPEPAGSIRLEIVPRDPHRPAGPRFGTLVHAILRDVDLRHDSDALEKLASIQGRVLGAPEAEVEAAIEAVRAALRHPIMETAAEAGYLARELPVRLHNPDGTMLEGEIDLVYGNEGQDLVVVDFKTDQDPSLRRDKYERQLAWYAHALRTAHGRPVHAVILVV